MNTRKLKLIIAIPALAAVLAGYGTTAYADDDREDRNDRDRRHELSCKNRIVGSYLTTISNNQGVFSSRSIMTFHSDGNVSAVNSAQGGGLQKAGFSAQLGRYKCTGRRRASALTLDFGFTDSPNLARTDWKISFDRKRRSIKGTAVLFIIPDAENADPFADDLPPVDTFTFDSVRVPARVR